MIVFLVLYAIVLSFFDLKVLIKRKNKAGIITFVAIAFITLSLSIAQIYEIIIPSPLIAFCKFISKIFNIKIT